MRIVDIEKILAYYIENLFGNDIIGKYVGVYQVYIEPLLNDYRLNFTIYIDHKFINDGLDKIELKIARRVLYKDWLLDKIKNKISIHTKIDKQDKHKDIKVSMSLTTDELLRIVSLAKIG